MNHDQNFKNLILDYPRPALEFFAEEKAATISDMAKITPMRQEQLQDRLGEHFRESDTPLLVESPKGEKEAILFILEEETTTRHFSIYRLAHYCLDLAELLALERVVPVVIFLKPGHYPCSLHLGTTRKTYLDFQFIACDLGTIPAEKYLDSRNIVARINLPNMRQERQQRVNTYLRAQEGLAQLEPDPNKRVKYIDLIARYANLTESEQAQYEEYIQQSSYKEVIMGPVQQAIEKGIQQGIQSVQQEIEKGLRQGIQGVKQEIEKKIQEGREKGLQEKAIEVARASLARGMDVSIIADISGLSEEEIRKLSIH
uniref:Transposase (putative) YhgA-like domain-containing protein n=1 Tax=Candidatus Kentrum sp. FW TaxID=2126338 RepID=A0A450TXD8_9GAMM|nr:MAG: conserved hypothetical protein (putative transposase or invertase) [Candidatus Kentron sp. FW]